MTCDLVSSHHRSDKTLAVQPQEVPLVFALISGKATADYVAILQHAVQQLQPSSFVITVTLSLHSGVLSVK